MQLVESSAMGLRSARFTLVSPRSGVVVTLFPMIHVGEPAFYEAVYADAFSQDVVLVEGVNSPITRRVTRSYRWIEHSRKIDLIVQPRYPRQSDCSARIVHADLSAEEFAEAWGEVPLWLRVLVYIAAPYIGLRRRLVGSRESLAKGMSVDDQASQKELLNWSPEAASLTAAIMDARDKRLIERLREQLDAPAAGPRRLAIVYGAFHMRAVLRELTKGRGFYADRGDWLTVFPLTPADQPVTA